MLTDYLEEINYAGTSAAPTVTAMSVAPPLQTVAQPPAIIGSNGNSQSTTAAAPPPARTLKERLAALKELLDEGLVTQEEFDARRKDILAEV